MTTHCEPKPGVREILISGGDVITMDPQRRIFSPGYVHIRGDRIAGVGPLDGSHTPPSGVAPGTAPGAEAIDARGMIVLPGLIDTHGHAGHGLTKSVGEHLGDDWVPLVEDIYYRRSTPDFWYAEAMLSGLERLKFGTTCGFSMLGSSPRCDDPVYAERHMAGHRRVGARNILGIGPPNPPWPKPFRRIAADGRVTADHDVDLTRAIAVTAEVVETYRADPAASRLLVQVAPSRVGQLPGLDLAATRHQHDQMRRIASAAGVMINGHAYGGDISYAHEHLGILGPDVMLAHCTGINRHEVQILAQTGAAVSHGPSTHSYQRARCPVMELVHAGALVTISTDGSGPDRTFDLFKEMRMAMIHQRAYFHDTSLLPPGQALAMVTIEAARGLGLDALIGSLEPGKKADVILVRADQPHMYPAVQPLQRAVYAASGQDVDTVVVDGEILMRGRRVLSIDEQEVLALAHREATAAFARAGIGDGIMAPPVMWGSASLR
ncbi:MAG: amidohydrolase family protein [Bacillota bacterium]|nr:amidohydrolase family protein [Bacillota bacterium]